MVIVSLGLASGEPAKAPETPLSADAQTDPQVKDLPGDEWRPLGVLNAGDGKNIVRVQSLDGAPVTGGGTGTLELVYAMPALETVKKKRKIPAVGGVETEEEATGLVLGNAPAVGNPGEPVLPVVPCYVVLPAGQEYGGVEVAPGKKVNLKGTHTVKHGQKGIPLKKGAKVEYVPADPKIYGSDEAWPAERFKVIGVQKKRGVSILVVNLNPVVYRPKSGKLSYFTSMKLSITTKPQTTTQGKNAVRYRPDPARPLSKQVDNPAELGTYEAKK